MDLKKVPNDPSHAAGARLMFQASDVESADGLRMLDSRHHTLQDASADFFRGRCNSFFKAFPWKNY